MTKKKLLSGWLAALVITASSVAHAGCIDGCDDDAGGAGGNDLSIGATAMLDSSGSSILINYQPVAWSDITIRPTTPKIRVDNEDLDITFYPRPDNYNFVCDSVLGSVSQAFRGTEIGSLLEWGNVGKFTAQVRLVSWKRNLRSSETIYCKSGG
jgi:hypothetical protein